MWKNLHIENNTNTDSFLFHVETNILLKTRNIGNDRGTLGHERIASKTSPQPQHFLDNRAITENVRGDIIEECVHKNNFFVSSFPPADKYWPNLFTSHQHHIISNIKHYIHCVQPMVQACHVKTSKKILCYLFTTGVGFGTVFVFITFGEVQSLFNLFHYAFFSLISSLFSSFSLFLRFSLIQ